jgi:hypothetical protein
VPRRLISALGPKHDGRSGRQNARANERFLGQPRRQCVEPLTLLIQLAKLGNSVRLFAVVRLRVAFTRSNEVKRNMPTAIQPRRGTGRFQWNVGAWSGSVIGNTAWMIVTSCFLLVNRQELIAAVPVGCFLVTNLIACTIWMRRERLDPFLSMMVILSVLSVTIPVAWVATQAWASSEALEQMNWPSGTTWKVVVLLAPAVMVWFIILEHRARSRFGRQRHDVQVR